MPPLPWFARLAEPALRRWPRATPIVLLMVILVLTGLAGAIDPTAGL